MTDAKSDRTNFPLIWVVLLFLSTQALAAAATDNVRVRIPSDAATLDWNKNTDSVSGMVIMQLMRGLTVIDRDGLVKPDLAEDWTYSDDRKTLRFRIRSGIKWSDGTTLSAKHFADSIERVLHPGTASHVANYLFDIAGARDLHSGRAATLRGLSVESESVLKLTLARPVTDIPALLTHPSIFPIRKDLIDRHGSKWTTPENLVVLGPYRLMERQFEKKLILQPNATSYMYKAEQLPMELRVVDEDATAIDLFDAKQLDLVFSIPAQASEKRKPRLTISALSRVSGLLFNKNIAPLNDNRVRLALATAINREQITQLVGGGVKANPIWLPIGLNGWSNQPRVAYNPVQARKLLSDAGFPGGSKFPTLIYIFPSRDENSLVAQRIQQQLKDNLGIKVELQSREFKTYLNTLKEKPAALMHFSWGSVFPDPINFLEAFYASGIARNAWQSSRFDQLVDSGKVEADEKKKLALLNEAEDLLLKEDVAIAPLYEEVLRSLVQAEIKGFELIGARVRLENLRREK